MQYGQGGGPIRHIATGTGAVGTIGATQVGVLPQTGPDTLLQVAVYVAAFLAIWGVSYLVLNRIMKTEA